MKVKLKIKLPEYSEIKKLREENIRLKEELSRYKEVLDKIDDLLD